MNQPLAPVRRRPRYILGTFWLILGLFGLFGAFTGGGLKLLLVGPLMIAYSVYLYRGGRFGFIVW
jgi:hypothetical protein